MKTAAIVIDAWKLTIFEKILDEEGYEYSEQLGPGECLTLIVETDDVDKLAPIVARMNNEARKSKMN